MQEIIKFIEGLHTTITKLRPVCLVESAKVTNCIDTICLTSTFSMNTQVAILDAPCQSLII